MIKVLIADDHNGMRSAFAMLLNQQQGIQVVADVPDGRSAVERLKQSGIDVALIDMMMPDTEGDEVIREVLAGDGFKPRMVIYSGFVTEDLVRRALDAGACGYLDKVAGVTETMKVIQAVARGEVCLCPEALAVVGEDEVAAAVRKSSERAFRVSAEEIVEEFLQRELTGIGQEWPEDVKSVYSAVVISVPRPDVSVSEILERARVSTGSGPLLFRIWVGLTIKTSQTKMKLRLSEELCKSGLTVGEAAHFAGYNSASALANARKRHSRVGEV